MRTILFALTSLALACPALAADVQPGRWQGTVDIPGNALAVTVDLDRDAGGAWIGSITMPELLLRGAPLAGIASTGSGFGFTLANALGGPGELKAGFQGRLGADGRLAGEFSQAGNKAPFSLARVGTAAVEVAPRSTPVPKALEGAWVGEYIGIGDYARQVTITLGNPAKDAAHADFVVVGKQTTKIPVDLVTFAEGVLRLESSTTGLNFEGRYLPASGEIRGTFEQGAFEFALPLKRKP